MAFGLYILLGNSTLQRNLLVELKFWSALLFVVFSFWCKLTDDSILGLEINVIFLSECIKFGIEVVMINLQQCCILK
jgi:hypothetical protein